jgi:hypothetical protein
LGQRHARVGFHLMAKLRSGRWLKLFEEFAKDLRITSKESANSEAGGDPLVMWESQRRFLQEVGSGLDNGVHVFNCLKSAQLGVTTISLAIDVFWFALHPNLIGCLVTDDEKKRDANRDLLTKYIESFEDGYFGDSFKIVKNNRTSMHFSNGGRLDLLVAGTKRKGLSWAEGVGYALAHITEIAKYGDVEGIKSLEERFAQQNPHRLYIFESTADGMNHWRTRWYDGLNDPMQRSFFIGWWSGDTNRIERNDPRFPIYGLHAKSAEEHKNIVDVARLYNHRITPEQLAWYRWKQTKAGAEQGLLDQNQPWTADQSFVMTGYSFFQSRVVGDDIKKLMDDQPLFQGYRYECGDDFFHFSMVKLDPEVDSVENVELKVWEEPHENGVYVIGFDPAYGRNDHKDANAILVWRCYADIMVQVAEYVVASDVKHASWVLFHLASAYRNCMINLEIGGPGALVMSEVKHLEQLLKSEMHQKRSEERGWEDAFQNARWYLYHRPDSMGTGYIYNFNTTGRTKAPLMHGFRGAYSSRELVIRSLGLLHEMSIVVVDDGEIGAPESKDAACKDDRVFAAAFSWMAWSEWIRKDMIASGQTYQVVSDSESKSQNEKMKGRMMGIVERFMASAEARANEEPQPPKWMRDVGLV